MKLIIGKIILFSITMAVLVFIVFGIGSCFKEEVAYHKDQRVQKKIYDARFPKVGDRIDLNGEEIVILKEYIWSRKRRFEVRYQNGSISDVMGIEIIDKKPIKEIDSE